ncbi:hypothetical protein UP12_19625 (plasmid) [Bacillus pumilus]|uniref:hypothetical protein n=1 Tax=Bacillus pumilus TaxID=1408 RepID=UPI0007760F03|nr:hypothetical protein [Bacillus pumilus]AMM99615.1 hypothetical protein UP12_19625 [Bacillus pumilus]
MKNKQEWVVRVTIAQVSVNIDFGNYTRVKETVEALNCHLSVVLRHFILNHYNPSANLDQNKTTNSTEQYKLTLNADEKYLLKINELNNAHWNRSNLFRDAFEQLVIFLNDHPEYYRRSATIIKSQYKIREELLEQLSQLYPFKQRSINIELFLKNHYERESFKVGIHKGATLKTTKIELDSLAHDILNEIANTYEVSKSVVMRDVVNQIIEHEGNKKELI